MIQNEQARFCLSRKISQLSRGRVVFGGKPLERIRARRQPCGRLGLVNQHVAAVTGLDRRLCWVRVTRDDDTAIGSIEPIAVAPHGMLRCEGSDRHVRVLVDDAGADLVGVDLMALREPTLVAIRVGARLDVDAVGFQDVFGHGLQALGAVDLQRHTTPNRPRRED